MFDINNRATWVSKAVLGERIHRIRTHARITREQFCDKLFISIQTYTRWRSGESYPYIEAIQQIADVFELTVEDILSVNSKIDDTEYDPSDKYLYTLWYDVDVPKRIRGLMQKKQITYEQLASSLGIDKRTVKNWLVGNNCPSKDTTEKLARYFRLSVADLLKEDSK